MKCTSIIFLEHCNEIPSPGMGSSAMPCHFTDNLFQAFTDKKYVKNINIQRGISLQIQMCIEIIGTTCTPQDQALGKVDMWSGFWSC